MMWTSVSDPSCRKGNLMEPGSCLQSASFFSCFLFVLLALQEAAEHRKRLVVRWLARERALVRAPVISAMLVERSCASRSCGDRRVERSGDAWKE